jgi:phytanoyl-CoA hydroxylase
MADTMTTPAEAILRTKLLPSGIGANQGIIEDDHIGWLRPTAKDAPPSEIRKRLQEDGYVFVKGLIPREDVMRTRKQ